MSFRHLLRPRLVALTALAYCPPETGATSEAEGVDGYRLRLRFIHPLPLRVLSSNPTLNWGV